jgi:hypothetical protein
MTEQVDQLAAIIRHVDGGNRLGAAALAEAILSHPDIGLVLANSDGPALSDDDLRGFFYRFADSSDDSPHWLHESEFIAATRALLAERWGEGPAAPESREPASVAGELRDEESRQLFCDIFDLRCDPASTGPVPVKFARAVLARWGCQPATPLEVKGASDKELLQIAGHAACIDDIQESWEEMLPIELTATEILNICRAVLARCGHQPTPPAEGEVGAAGEIADHILAELQGFHLRHRVFGELTVARLTSAAEPLQQQEAEINQLRAQQTPDEREATAIEALKRLRQWGRLSCVGSYSPAGGYSADVLVGVLDWIDGGMEGPLPPLPAHPLSAHKKS